MRYLFGKTIVMSLGGSIVHPDGIDTVFLKQFDRFIRKETKRERKFVLVVGGGKLSRRFQESARHVHPLKDDDADWLGIHATRLNAHLVRTIFRDIADPVVIDARHRVKRLRHAVTVASGWKPGWSTDYIAVRLAEDFRVPTVLVAGKPSHVYDKDPAKFTSAKKHNQISWSAYRKLIPKKWKPGLNAPVDPVAAKLADNEGLAVVVVNGRDLTNFERLLHGKEFEGTVIS